MTQLLLKMTHLLLVTIPLLFIIVIVTYRRIIWKSLLYTIYIIMRFFTINCTTFFALKLYDNLISVNIPNYILYFGVRDDNFKKIICVGFWIADFLGYIYDIIDDLCVLFTVTIYCSKY